MRDCLFAVQERSRHQPPFDVIAILLGGLSHLLTSADVVACFKCCHALLSPQGVRSHPLGPAVVLASSHQACVSYAVAPSRWGRAPISELRPNSPSQILVLELPNPQDLFSGELLKVRPWAHRPSSCTCSPARVWPILNLSVSRV